MAEYDRGYRPPDWWLEEFERVRAREDWKDGALAKQALAIDSRGKGWDSTRISKMRNGANLTERFVTALSAVMGIPVPFVEAASIEEARELQQFLRRRQALPKTDSAPRVVSVEQALDAAVKSAKDQTGPVVSPNEGSPRDPRTRRAPRGR